MLATLDEKGLALPPRPPPTTFPHAEQEEPSLELHHHHYYHLPLEMGSWTRSPVQDANLRGNSAVSITDSLPDQRCDLVQVTPLLCAYFLRWITYKWQNIGIILRLLDFQSRNFSEAIKKVRNSERGGCMPQSIRNEADYPSSRHQQQQRARKKRCPHGFLESARHRKSEQVKSPRKC